MSSAGQPPAGPLPFGAIRTEDGLIVVSSQKEAYDLDAADGVLDGKYFGAEIAVTAPGSYTQTKEVPPPPPPEPVHQPAPAVQAVQTTVVEQVQQAVAQPVVATAAPAVPVSTRYCRVAPDGSPLPCTCHGTHSTTVNVVAPPPTPPPAQQYTCIPTPVAQPLPAMPRLALPAAPPVQYVAAPRPVRLVPASPRLRYVAPAPPVQYAIPLPRAQYVAAAPPFQYVAPPPPVQYIAAAPPPPPVQTIQYVASTTTVQTPPLHTGYSYAQGNVVPMGNKAVEVEQTSASVLVPATGAPPAVPPAATLPPPTGAVRWEWANGTGIAGGNTNFDYRPVKLDDTPMASSFIPAAGSNLPLAFGSQNVHVKPFRSAEL